MDHHSDGSVTLTPEEVGQLRALLDSVMAGNRIQATLSRKSQEEYQVLSHSVEGCSTVSPERPHSSTNSGRQAKGVG